MCACQQACIEKEEMRENTEWGNMAAALWKTHKGKWKLNSI